MTGLHPRWCRRGEKSKEVSLLRSLAAGGRGRLQNPDDDDDDYDDDYDDDDSGDDDDDDVGDEDCDDDDKLPQMSDFQCQIHRGGRTDNASMNKCCLKIIDHDGDDENERIYVA